MNKHLRLIAIVLASLSLLAFASCDKDDDEKDVKHEISGDDGKQEGKDGKDGKTPSSPAGAFELAKAEIALAPKAVGEIAITKGNGEYEVSSSDEAVAKATIKDDKTAVVITAGEVTEEKTATITVKDKKANKELSITVTVSPTGTVKAMEIKALASGKLTLNPSEKSQEFQITGGKAPFSPESSDPEVATAEIKDGSKLVITAGTKQDEATITVKDADKGEITITVTVKVVKDIVLEETDVTIGTGEPAEIGITDGNGKYRVVEFTSPLLTSVDIATTDDEILIVAGPDAGSGTIKIEDSEGKTASITVTVEKLNDIEVEEDVALVAKATKTITITNGNGGYELVGFAETPQLKSATISGNKIELTAGEMEGTATITVQDAKGKTAEITVTVSYAELVVKEAVTIEASATLELAITSGNGGYEVVNFTANAQLASATINGDKVALTAGTAEGTATVNLQDAKGKTASITVTVVAAGSLIKLDGDNTKTVSYKLGDYPAQVKVTGGDIDTYTPTSSDEEIVTVEITNGGYFHPDDRNLNLTLRGKIGTATVTIEDGTATVAVLTVNVEDSDPIVVSQTDVTISTFMTETLEFTGGASTFTIKQEPEGFVLASTNTWATPKTLSIAPQKSGTTVLTITDEFGKESAAITVRIKLPIKISNTNTYQEYKDTEKIGVVEGKTNKILQIEGGQGTVNVETADASIATATIDAEGYIVISGVSAGEVALTVKDDAMEKTVNVQVIAGPAPGETQCFIVKDDYAIPFGTSDEIKANVAAEMASKGAIIMPSAATKIRKQDYPGYGMCLDGMLTVDLNNITTIEASAMQDFYKTKKFVLRKVQTVGASSFHAYYMEKFTLVLDMDKDAIGDMTIDPTWVGNKGAVIRCRDQECMEAAETAFENSENFGSIEFKNTLE